METCGRGGTAGESSREMGSELRERGGREGGMEGGSKGERTRRTGSHTPFVQVRAYNHPKARGNQII